MMMMPMVMIMMLMRFMTICSVVGRCCRHLFVFRLGRVTVETTVMMMVVVMVMPRRGRR